MWGNIKWICHGYTDRSKIAATCSSSLFIFRRHLHFFLTMNRCQQESSDIQVILALSQSHSCPSSYDSLTVHNVHHHLYLCLLNISLFHICSLLQQCQSLIHIIKFLITPVTFTFKCENIYQFIMWETVPWPSLLQYNIWHTLLKLLWSSFST